MSKIIFMNNPEKIYTCDFSQIGESQIRLIFDLEDIPSKKAYLSGCCLVNEWNPALIQTNREDYKYLYRKYENEPNIIELCNDNIPYSDNGIEIEYPEYTPTLEEVKTIKIAEFSRICNQMITNGVDIDVDGNIEHFSYTDEDQRNIKELFDIVLQTNNSMYYHSDNGGCKLYSVDQIINLYISEVTNKMHHTTYFNQMKMYIESLDDNSIISNITYGTELPGEYLDTYNNAMLKAKENIDFLLQNIQQLSSAKEG